LVDRDINYITDRLYTLETAYKGFTTRLRILEAEVERLKALPKESLDLGNTNY
jgi:hypothetical protein